MWLEYLRIAWAILYGQKFRSLLTVGSITIGVFSIVFMSSLAEAGFATLNAGIEEVGGARILALWSRQPDEPARQASYWSGISRQDLQTITTLPHLQGMTLVADESRQDLFSDTGQKLLADVVGTDPEFFSFFKYRISEGRFFDAQDQREHRRVCVLGDSLAEKLEQSGPKALGRLITIKGLRCLVIGRLAKVDRTEVGFGWDWDEVVALPIETLADRVGSALQKNRWLLLHSDHPSNNEVLVRLINVLIRERHHGLNDFNLLNFHKSFTEEFEKIVRIMKVIVSLLAGIALLVGGVGIMNMMLVSVSERVREIGIRKALGASPSDIGRQFLLEAILLSSLGGFLGVGLGLLGGLLGGLIIQHYKPSWIIILSEPAAVLALGVALGIGVLFGYVPARRASRIDPILAIRTEG